MEIFVQAPSFLDATTAMCAKYTCKCVVVYVVTIVLRPCFVYKSLLEKLSHISPKIQATNSEVWYKKKKQPTM